MKTCKRTHQLCRNGSYWEVARTECGKEKRRDETTTTDERVTCPECLRSIILKLHYKLQKLNSIEVNL